MTRDQIKALLVDAQQRSVRAYLRRQDVQAQIQSWQQQGQQVDRELLHLDGQIAVLESLLALPGSEP